VIHGDRDFVVPLASARDAARRTGGDLVVVKGAGHSWLLKDPETFPAIVGQLLQGRLGESTGIDQVPRFNGRRSPRYAWDVLGGPGVAPVGREGSRTS